MVAFVDEGIRMRAFDEGSYAYIDQWVAMKLDGWLTHLEEEFRLRQDSAAWIVGGRIENLSVASGVLAEAQDGLAELDNELARLRAVLRGPQQPTDAPAVERSERGVAPVPPVLLAAASLTTPDEPAHAVPVDASIAPTRLTTIHAVDPDGSAQSVQSR